MPILCFSPLTTRYAVIRMDPVGTVERYDYSDIREAAKGIQAKAYLVYLRNNHNLPIPGRPWHAFEVALLATSLPPIDEEEGITQDMCAPIFPNTTHPTGREPLNTDPVFPYDNCYHWSDDAVRMDVRVRARPEKFDDDMATKLTSESQSKLRRYTAQDVARMNAACVEPPEGMSDIDGFAAWL
ncbi:hypothetical protein OH76DRAFT_1352135 [Lentinus brumalis]|uniref:Uncharacterized protein n=1 Tax=Lentinus brumalis TaxID=2498619 RepID=A0A371D827_9APHY|nr:hypothetical protein OH76DRAFT_1352135 [Polyporus brumalis]